MGFALRLFAAFAITLVLVGFVGYRFIDQRLDSSHLRNYAADQHADARTFEAYGRSEARPGEAIRRIQEALGLVARRSGTLETLLVDAHGIVRATGEPGALGTFDSDERIEAALREGRSYAGREADGELDQGNFEFVTPIDLPEGRFAYEISYSHAANDAQLAQIRRGLLLVGLLALLGGGLVFYLVGGRSLLRIHRSALLRATIDGLTDLPNQRAFQDELPRAVAASARSQDALALLALDVDDFKFSNDRHGHLHGDDMLRRVAAVLREGRPADRAYRIGGDEFAVLLPHTDVDGVRVLARRTLRALGEAGVQASIGISALRPGQSADELRAEADASLYEAKRAGGHRVACFDDIRGTVRVTSTEKSTAVRALIQAGRVETVYQPIWNLRDDTLLGLEALTRIDAAYGLAGPAEAFEIAEQIGHVRELDAICVEHALAGAADLPEGALLFVNVSPRTLDRDAGDDDWLPAAAARHGLACDRIVIEVTERFAGRTGSVVKALRRLQAAGFRIAVDDVGTGNSGLQMLREVETEFVKIDRSIVAAVVAEPGARGVLLAIATYATQTGAYVIAEGIEGLDTLEYLRSIDDQAWRANAIHGGQGFGLGHPAPLIASLRPGLRRPAA